jgi:hypothetical protein
MRISQSQLTRLGDRLRKEAYDEADLRLLDEYRREFTAPYEAVMHVMRRFGDCWMRIRKQSIVLRHWNVG